ncbi:hypothetical protein ILUMI_23655 [Ignelater luminosus]|uniref:Mutator-like transposase domain-containing protein n=1 Tax=Ignelater luminosus TaxID=2038154 RepID=A0A8K0C8E8_IGNLU|nr:hypothetical protein ILUMI_23655 [Ignelater luminosus]
MDMPTPSPKFYRKLVNDVGRVWEMQHQSEMKKAAEERKLAIEAGDIEEGIPFITVIVDGGWAKYSYGHGFLSLSGVRCIIGRRTKKLLYIGESRTSLESNLIDEGSGEEDYVSINNLPGNQLLAEAGINNVSSDDEEFYS